MIRKLQIGDVQLENNLILAPMAGVTDLPFRLLCKEQGADFDMTLFGHQANASIFFLNALGFPNALIYAGIWPLSIHGLGKFTKTGSSLLIMGLCGNAILPLVYGHFADQYSLRIGYWVLIPCFIYLVFFAIKGHKINSWR